MHVLTSRLTKTRKNGLLLCVKNDSFIQNGSILFFRADEQGNTPIFVGFLRLSVGLSLGLASFEYPRPFCYIYIYKRAIFCSLLTAGVFLSGVGGL